MEIRPPVRFAAALASFLLFAGSLPAADECPPPADSAATSPAPPASRWLETGLTGWPSPLLGNLLAADGKLWLIGDSTSRANWRFDPATEKWTRLADLPPAFPVPWMRETIWTGKEFLAWGGWLPLPDGSGSIPAAFGAAYDPATDRWRALPSEGAPTPDCRILSAWTGHELVVWAPHDSTSGSGSPTGTGARYDPATDRWAPISSLGAPPAYCWLLDPAWTGSRFMVFRRTWDGSTYAAEGFDYDPVKDEWNQIPPTGTLGPSRQPTPIWNGSRVYLVSNYSFPGWPAFDPRSRTWKTISKPTSVDSTTTRGWCAGNFLAMGSYVNWTTYSPPWTLFDPTTGAVRVAADEWNCPQTPTYSVAIADPLVFAFGLGTGGAIDTLDVAAGAWHPRIRPHGAQVDAARAWTGHELFVWGGVDLATLPASETLLGEGELFDPATDSWRPISASGAPPPRRAATAVRVGREVALFGGRAGGLDLVDASLYDPATDRWRPFPMVGTQSAFPVGPILVGGDEGLVLLGGKRLGTPVMDGLLYSTATGRWTRLPDTGLIEASHDNGFAAWIDGRIILWRPDLAQGVVLDPGATAWRPITDLDAPGQRAGGIAGAAGNLFYVGAGSANGLADPLPAGLYDPATDRWAIVPPDGACRRFQSIVWTGRELVFWSGNDGDVRTGVRFDPVSLRYRPLPRTGAPAAEQTTDGSEGAEPIRDFVAWTGHALLVWGFQNGGLLELVDPEREERLEAPPSPDAR